MQSSLLTLDSFFFSVFKFLFCILMFFFPLQYRAILPYLLKGNSVVSEMVENSYMQIIVFKCVLAWLFYYCIPKISDSDWKEPTYNEETRVRSLDQEDSPREGEDNPLQYSFLENPVDKEHGRLRSKGPQRVGHG